MVVRAICPAEADGTSTAGGAERSKESATGRVNDVLVSAALTALF
jgi:hypothetical protein